ncbi:hypothetical protein ACLOJK_008111 [Asimina triloba]
MRVRLLEETRAACIYKCQRMAKRSNKPKRRETEREMSSSCKALPANRCSLLPRSQLSARKSMESVGFANFPTAQFPPAQSKHLSIVGGREKQGRNGASSVRATLKARAVKTEDSFYELLGIPETVGISEIKQAYKQLARKYHPDVSPPDRLQECTRRFILVQEAYETLSDPRLREMYDRDLARGLHLAFSARKRFDEFASEFLCFYSQREFVFFVLLPSRIGWVWIEYFQAFVIPERGACLAWWIFLPCGLRGTPTILARMSLTFVRELEVKSEWKDRWEDQLSELKMRSDYKNSEANMSWGARMRRQRDESSEDL